MGRLRLTQPPRGATSLPVKGILWATLLAYVWTLVGAAFHHLLVEHRVDAHSGQHVCVGGHGTPAPDDGPTGPSWTEDEQLVELHLCPFDGAQRRDDAPPPATERVAASTLSRGFRPLWPARPEIEGEPRYLLAPKGSPPCL